MSLRLRLVFEDGTEREIAGLPWQTVFQAAQAHGIELATDCREGACGTCKARCTEGEYDVGDASPEALTAEEEAAGLVLTCQMLPLGDCALRFPYPFSLTGGPARRQAVLEAVERVAEDTVRFELALDAALPFLPGQYARIGVPGTGAERAFSFSRRDRAEFHARLLPDGLMSGWLAARAQARRPARPVGALWRVLPARACAARADGGGRHGPRPDPRHAGGAGRPPAGGRSCSARRPRGACSRSTAWPRAARRCASPWRSRAQTRPSIRASSPG